MADLLRKLYVEITTRCNLACGMCVRQTWDETDRDMPPELFQRLAAQIEPIASLECVQLGGFGEPTMHPNLLDFIGRLKQAGRRVELVTNATRLDRKLADQIVAAGLDRLIVSLDSLDGPSSGLLHDETAIGARERLRQTYLAKLAVRSALPEVAVAFVATADNLHQLPELKRIAGQLGISRVLVSNLIAHSRPESRRVLYGHWTTTRRHNGSSPWNPTIDLPRMDGSAQVMDVLDRLRTSGTHLQLLGNDIFGGPMQCRFVRDGSSVVGVQGQVSPCLPLLHSHSYYYGDRRRQVRAYHVGSIADKHLETIWHSNQYRTFRRRVERFEFSPCLECSGCELRETNEEDCLGNPFPCCGECLWAAGFVQCP